MSGAVQEIDRLLASVLPEGSLYAVGGRVRDEVRSSCDGIARTAKDLDYVVVGVALDEVVARLAKVGRADVVGASFAVVKATLGSLTVDVALPRRERSTGVGHRAFAIESGPDVPLDDDLARRDFRMNMLARALPDGLVIDPYGGQADIRAKRIDVLRREAFAEDPLRMLRACQFAARFDFWVSPETLWAMKLAAPLIVSVSHERVRDELSKMLESSEKPSLGIELMREAGLLQYVLPEVAEGIDVPQNIFHAYDVYRHSLASTDAVQPGDLVLRLAALLHDVGKPRTRSVDAESTSGAHFYRHESVGAEMARGVLERLRFAHDVVDDVHELVAHHMYSADPHLDAKAIRRFIRRVGPNRLKRQFALRAADIVGSGLPKRDDSNERFQVRVAEMLAERPPLGVADLAIGGSEVIAALVRAGRLPKGSRGGPEVGNVLRHLLEKVLDDPALNDSGTLTKLLEAEVRQGSLTEIVAKIERA